MTFDICKKLQDENESSVVPVSPSLLGIPEEVGKYYHNRNEVGLKNKITLIASLVFQIRLKIYKILPERTKKKLRLCCKQLKWEIDHLVGLKIKVRERKNRKRHYQNFEWIQDILIGKLTFRHSYSDYIEVCSPWTSLLTNGGLINLNRLSLSGPKLRGEADLASIFTAVSTLSSLRELSLECTHFEASFSQDKSNSISSISTSTEGVYNFPNLTTLNLHFGVSWEGIIPGESITNLESFPTISCPQLEFLSVRMQIFNCQPRNHYLVWCLELVEKFSNSLQYLSINKVSVFPSQFRDWKTIRAKTEEKAFIVGSQLKKLKGMDIVLFEAEEVSVWTNFFQEIRTRLEKLKIDFQNVSVWEMYNRSALVKNNCFPNLKSLSVSWLGFSLDLEKITQISNRLEILELSASGYHLGKSLEKIPFSLKKLVLLNSLVCNRGGCVFLKNCMSARESLIVKYDHSINTKMIECLGIFLTNPNFIWKGIKHIRDKNELRDASALCEKFGIPSEKLLQYDC